MQVFTLDLDLTTCTLILSLLSLVTVSLWSLRLYTSLVLLLCAIYILGKSVCLNAFQFRRFHQRFKRLRYALDVVQDVVIISLCLPDQILQHNVNSDLIRETLF